MAGVPLFPERYAEAMRAMKRPPVPTEYELETERYLAGRRTAEDDDWLEGGPLDEDEFDFG